jgi:GNAT superfamily N-acetyltransferase
MVNVEPHIVSKTSVILIEWFDGDKMVGHVEMCEDVRPDETFYETHVFLDEEYRNKGYGVLMYDHAFDVATLLNVTVKSSLVPSDDAHRVWNSRELNERWNIGYVNKRYVVIGKRI